MEKTIVTLNTLSYGNYEKALILLIFIIALLLRFSLAVYNTQANDNHFEVIDIILKENKIPEREDCWECFQPKLFHLFLHPWVHWENCRVIDRVKCIDDVSEFFWVVGVFLAMDGN